MVLSPKQKPALHMEARSLGVSGMMWMIAPWRTSMVLSPKQKPALHVEPSGLGLSGMSSRLTHTGTCTKCTEREMYRRRISCSKTILYIYIYIQRAGWPNGGLVEIFVLYICDVCCSKEKREIGSSNAA